MRTRVEMVCPQCGSHDIFSDAAARYCTINQDWVLATAHDNTNCNECGFETDDCSVFERALEDQVGPVIWSVIFEHHPQRDETYICIRDQYTRLIADMPIAPDSQEVAQGIVDRHNAGLAQVQS